MLSPPHNVALRELSSQNHYAARQIQKLFRGHATRKVLWSYDGVLTARAVVKIQRCWRGSRGRQQAAHRYLFFVTEKMEIIRGLCRCWKARRILRMKRAARLNQCATMLQCLFRTRTSRKYFQQLQREALKRRAVLLQRHVRGFVARRWVGRLGRRVRGLRADIMMAMQEDVKLANTMRAKMTLELVPPPDPARARLGLHLPSLLRQEVGREQQQDPRSDEACEKWNLLHAALCHLVGTGRPEFTVDLCLQLVHRHPSFLPAHFVLAASMLSCWCAPAQRSAQVLREYYMEEAVALVLRLQALQLAELKAHNERHGLPRHDRDDPICTLVMDKEVAPFERPGARERDCLLQLEQLYFRAGLVLGGVCTRSLALLASFVMVRAFSTFGSGMQRLGPRQGAGMGRARRLLDRARECGAPREAEGITLRLDVFRNLFECSHESIMRHRKVFHDLREESESANKKPVHTDLEFFRCGEVLLVCGYIVAHKDKDKDRRREAGVAPVADAAKWTPAKCDVTMRPLVLLPQEALRVYEQAVAFTTSALGKTEMEVRQKPRWKLLSEYVMQGIRIHSCGRGREDLAGSSSSSGGGMAGGVPSMQSVVRLSLPCVEYARQERNDLRLEQHCAKLLQRAYRGFQGRALWKRLHMRVLEQRRQKAAFRENFERMKNLRDWRYKQLALIQSRAKGWYVRRMVAREKAAALLLQCMVRRVQAKQRVAQERVRRNGGPEVVEMVRRGGEVSGVKLLLVLSRCGLNYKLVGHDVMGGAQYQGFVHQPAVLQLIEDHNAQLPGTSWAAQQAHIKPWQHVRVAEMLLQRVSLTAALAPITTELTKGNLGRRAEKVFVFVAGVRGGAGVASRPGGRVLADEAGVVAHFEKLQASAALKAERAAKIKQRQMANKSF